LPPKAKLEGQKFGRLTIICSLGSNVHGKVEWLCVCDCANDLGQTETKTKIIPTGDWNNHNYTSCGCLRKGPKDDITGTRFGRLVALYNTGKQDKYNYYIWMCDCKCGKRIEVSRNQLKKNGKGGSKSCGCLKKEYLDSQGENLTGKVFGKYTVIEPTNDPKRNQGKRLWRCRCECGNEHIYKRHIDLKTEKQLYCDECRAVEYPKLYGKEMHYKWNGYNAFDIPTYDTYADKIGYPGEVRRKSKDRNILEVRCKYCGKWFTPTKQAVWGRVKAMNSDRLGTDNHLYCSQSCKDECPIFDMKKRSKDEYSNYRKGTSREVQPQLRQMVFERDNYTCQKCEKNKNKHKNVKLHCHHYEGIMQNPIESADVDACTTLCKKCHLEVHKEKGCRPSDLRCK